MPFGYMNNYFSGKETLFIMCRHPKIRNSIHMHHISMILTKKMYTLVDIVNVFSLDKIPNINKYKTIILDSLVFSYFSRPYYNIDDLYAKLKDFRGRVILKTLDIHEWSFVTSKEYHGIYKPILEDTNDKRMIKEILKKCNVSEMTFYCYCPESVYWTQYFADIINKFYIINHGIYKEFMRDGMNKKYDVLFYSSSVKKLYPFRYRILDICRTMDIRLRVIDRKEHIIEDRLYEEINKSWLTIATHSTYSYLVQKYFEIPASSSVPLGNMNGHGKSIFGDNYININESMSDDEIKKIITDALNNKEKLTDIIKKNYEIVKHHTFDDYVDNLMSVVNQDASHLEFMNVEKKINSM